MSSPYEAQHRGDASAYASYFAGMDASMQQKVAYTTAHFPTRGVVADMGSGSGMGTYQLAQLHPHLQLVGVDINPVSVAHAQSTYQRPNLEFRVGDIAARLFPPGSLDGILDSSVFHHLTSFNQFDTEQVRRALEAQAEALREGGVIVIRDFVIGRGPELVLMDLPTTDGSAEGPVPGLSTAALFERFAEGFRSSVNPDWPVPHSTTALDGFARVKLPRRLAAEFLLRKDYRDAWDAELLEEYTYFTQADFERELGQLGLRVVVSQEVHNPWIVENRFRGKVELWSVSGEPLGFPPTNFVIVGEKVRAGSGVRLREAIQRRDQTPSYLSLEVFRRDETGEQYELVRRPHQTVDLLPYFERDGRLHVVARQGFPRPILLARPRHSELSHVEVSGFVTEPVTAVADEGTDTRAVERILRQRGGLEARSLSEELTFFPSPGGVNERVSARLVEIDPGFESREAPNTTPFISAGTLRELDAHQLLRASQVGGLFDARLEMLVYQLLHERGCPLEPWIGAQPALTRRAGPELARAPLEQVLRRSERRSWTRADTSAASFLEIRSSDFVEESAEGASLRTARFEYVVPKRHAATTLSVLPILAQADDWLVGVERRDLPAVGELFGGSELAAAPAWRLPATVRSLDEAERWLRRRIEADFGALVFRAWQLGGRYFPSSGVTPEVVYPHLCEIDPGTAAAATWTWVSLRELLAARKQLHDAHLLTLVFRAAHALGVPAGCAESP